MLSGPGFSVTFLYYFVCTSVIVAFLASKELGLSLTTSEPYRIGILAGLLVGTIGAYFNRSIAISVPVTNQKSFTRSLRQKLIEMGFQEKSQLEDYTLYEKPNMAAIFSGKIVVQVEKDSVTISGRSSVINALRKKITEDAS